MAYRCVVFDFDGTLADTEEIAFEIYNEMASRYKYHPITREELMHIKNLHIKEIMEIVDIPFIKLPRVINQGQKRMRVRAEEIRAFNSGIKGVMDELSKETEIIGILTSNIKRTVRSFLKQYEIETDFDFLLSSALLSKQKKIRKVLKKYDLKAEELLYIGDETRDIEACHIAGVDVAAVRWGYNSPAALERCHPTYMIEDLEALIKIVKEKR